MNLPPKVKVGLYDYTIERWDPREASASARYAECCHPTRRIRIDAEYGRKQAAYSLLHEVLHAIEVVWSIPLSNARNSDEVIEPMSMGLSTVWRDNPEVMKWIAEGLTDGDGPEPQ